MGSRPLEHREGAVRVGRIGGFLTAHGEFAHLVARNRLERRFGLGVVGGEVLAHDLVVGHFVSQVACCDGVNYNSVSGNVKGSAKEFSRNHRANTSSNGQPYGYASGLPFSTALCPVESVATVRYIGM